MPNLAVLLKSEISRVARKEVREEIQGLRKASSEYRSHIAALKRRVNDLERKLKTAVKASGQRVEDLSSEPPKTRYSAKSLAAQRRRLGLSAADLARLLQVSSLSVYKWESGKTRPRASQLPAIAALRSMAKKDAVSLLQALKK